METGEVSRQARPRGFGEAAPITADQLASAIASAQTALGMPTPSSPGRVKVLKNKVLLCALFMKHDVRLWASHRGTCEPNYFHFYMEMLLGLA